jgi:hypothetical protein
MLPLIGLPNGLGVYHNLPLSGGLQLAEHNRAGVV